MNRHLIKIFILAALFLAALPWTSSAEEILGKDASKWRADLNSTDARVRRNAAFAFGRGGGAYAVVVDNLLKMAENDDDASVREAAAYAVGEIGATTSAEAIRVLKGVMIKDKDEKVRRSAAYALGCYGRHAAAAKNDLERALNDTEPSVRQNAAWALGQLGDAGGARDAVPTLRRLLSKSNEKDELVRRDAATALSDIGRSKGTPTQDELDAVNDLVKAFRTDDDKRVRRAALTALVNVARPENKAAAKELTAILNNMRAEGKSADIEQLYDVAYALGNIGGKDGQAALPVLLQGLDDPDPAQRQQSSASLGGLGEYAADAVPKLGEVLNNDKDADVRRNAALALGRIGPKAKSAVPNLVKALDPSEPDDVRRYAVEAIAYIGPEAAERALRDLFRVIRDDKAWRVRQRAVWALSGIQDLEKSGVVPELEPVLDETDKEIKLVRYEAAVLLGTRLEGKVSPKVIKVLVENLNDKDIKIYTGAAAGVAGGGPERQGSSGVTESSKGDARWLPAMAVAAIGKTADKPEVEAALTFAKDDSKDLEVADWVDKARKSIKGQKWR